MAAYVLFLGASGQATNTLIVDWGDDTFDQLYPAFTQRHVTAISTGYEHTVAVLDSTTVISWGDNTYGQLSIPAGIENPVKVVAGLGHSVVLQADGRVVAWGFNEFGQTNVAAFAGVTDIAAGDEHTLLLVGDSVVLVSNGSNTYDLTVPIAAHSGVQAVASGNFHMLALKTDGTVVAWGANEFGQAVVPGGLSDVVAIEAGLFHSYALRSDGTLVGWGDTRLYNQLQTPGLVDFTELRVGDYHTLAMSASQGLVAWGSNRFNETSIPQVLNGRNIVHFTAGFAHNTVIAENQQPTAINVADTVYVDEEEDPWIRIAQLTSTDPDEVDAFIYRLVAGLGDMDNASFALEAIPDKTNITDEFLFSTNNFGEDYLLAAVSFNYEEDSLFSLRLRSTDLGGLFTEKRVIVKINNINEDPLEIFLSADTIRENQPVGTFIGVLSTDDTDLYDSFIYSLVSGNGSAGNASFQIRGDSLFSNAVFLADEQNTYQIRVRSTDQGGLFVEERFVIHVLQHNEAPTDIFLSRDTIPDNLPVGSLVGFFTTEDPDPEDSHTYSLVSGTGDTDNGAFTISSTALMTAVVLDSSVQSVYFIRVRSTDNGKPEPLYLEKVFRIVITGVNDAPVQITLSNDTIVENEPVNTLIGRFATVDPDAGNQHAYTLVSGSGSTNNASFHLQGDRLLASEVFAASVQDLYFIRVRSTDSEGLYAEEQFTIKVIPLNESPTEILLSNDSILDNLSIGSLVGFFSTADPDPEDTHTYNLVPGDGDVDNGAFQLVGNSLITNTLLDSATQDRYFIRVRSTDNGRPLAEWIERTFVITVYAANQPPQLPDQSFSVLENVPDGTQIGVLEVVDEGAVTFTILSGNELGIFQINSTGALLVAEATQLNATATPHHYLTVQVTDEGGKTGLGTVHVEVIYVPAPPEVANQQFTIREDARQGTLIGQFVASSLKGNNLSYIFETGNTNNTFAIQTNGMIVLNDSSQLDAIRRPVYTIQVAVIDSDQQLTSRANAVITVEDVNFAPSEILLDNHQLDEQQPVNTRIGAFTTLDRDISDRHTYSLVSGEGDADNVSFKVVGNNLFSAEIFEARVKNEYTIRVRSTDDGVPSMWVEAVFLIEILPLELPQIPTAITPNGDLENDIWEIPNLELYPNCQVEIYDRSGRRVFSSQGYRTLWDGTFQGRELPVASYYYIIQLNNPANTEYSGIVSILR